MHELVRKRYGGKAFCISPLLECLADKMHLCSGEHMKMVHWAGGRKPWREWWDTEKHEPREAKLAKCGGGQCQAVALESVKLWWSLHDELAAALAGTIDPLHPAPKLHPRGHGAKLRFFEDM